MDLDSQSNVTKSSTSLAASKNEITVRTFEQILGPEFEISDEMAIAIRALQKVCRAINVDPVEQLQYGLERQTIYLKKLLASRKDRQDSLEGRWTLSERAWVRASRKAMRISEKKGM